MTEAEAQAVLAEFAARNGLPVPGARRKADKSANDILKGMHRKQRAFVKDDSKRIAADPGRRGGKTTGVAGRLVRSALLHPGPYWSTYTAITRQQAKDLVWQTIKDLAAGHGAVPNESELTLKFPNRHTIKLFGADKLPELEKKRGYAIAEAAVDEAASFAPKFLQYFIDEILEPATLDLDGTITMIGTPANHCMGPFYDACTDPGSEWSHHHWTVLDNSYIRHAKRWLARLRKRRGWTEANPIYLREYLGQWVRSLESIVYPFDRAKNGFTALPGDFRWRRILGIDLGANEEDPSTAFAVWYFHESHPHAFLRQAFRSPVMTPSEIAATVQELEDTHGDFEQIVADTGALGKAIAKEMVKRHGIPVKAAEKRDKYDFIHLMQDDLRSGRVRVHEKDAADWVEEAQVLQWDPEKPHKEDKRFANHTTDAGLYGWREVRNWLYEPEKVGPPEKSEAWYRKEAKRMEQATIERLQQREDAPWWAQEY